MAGDILASIKPRRIEDIVINGQRFFVPAHTAWVWLDILLAERWGLADIVPGLTESDGNEVWAPDHINDALLTGALGYEEYEELVYELIGIAAGRPWWTALRLLDHVTAQELGGWVRGQLVLHHIDAMELSFAAWLDALYGILTMHADSAKMQQFDAMLARPVSGGPKAKLNRRQQRAAFAAVMGT